MSDALDPNRDYRLTRRQFTAGLASVFLSAEAIASTRTQKLAVLDWGWAESLLALDFQPFAVAEAPLYGDRIVTPALSTNTIDLGLRSWPNVELLRALKPDLILSQAGYGISAERLRAIAPTLAMPLYSPARQPLLAAENALNEIAHRIGRQELATRYLERSYARLDTIAHNSKDYDGCPLLIIKFTDDRLVDIYGAGGLFDDVLKRIGIANAWDGKTNNWGFATAGLEAIARYPEARLVIIEPGPPGSFLQSALWNALPAVRKGRVSMIPPTWVFGAFPSAMRFAEVLRQSLGIA
ncbi:Iron(III)-hydroxamate-binding protein FhuD [Agrobacterium sp. DSM 25558]|uniref:ABC transporter substrate-binding protein n=1 Tax=Agrobacterium sp. DSM 25558 TaxID=1907665 RepID=UPI000972426C|nr:ABC transporter substrate-binding protein [Agrobacterium sp. DSM 25558]SCX31018.1 Iron(III)-hydroxamate-binding protein FhuD [Agrobacterium sp. DSM 25558]